MGGGPGAGPFTQARRAPKNFPSGKLFALGSFGPALARGPRRGSAAPGNGVGGWASSLKEPWPCGTFGHPGLDGGRGLRVG